MLGYEDSLPLLETYQAEAVFVTEDKEVIVTDGLKDMFTLTDSSYEQGGRMSEKKRAIIIALILSLIFILSVVWTTHQFLAKTRSGKRSNLSEWNIN